jgi:hypothetical protein
MADETAKKQVAITIPWQKISAAIFKMVTSVFFLMPIIFVMVMVIIFALYRKFQERLVADPARLRQRQALKVARRKLRKASDLLKRDELKEFFGEIFNAMAAYLGDKYGFSVSGITTDELRDILIRKGQPLEAQKQLESFVFECDLLRFTPSSLIREKAVDLSQVAEELIVAIEKNA